MVEDSQIALSYIMYYTTLYVCTLGPGHFLHVHGFCRYKLGVEGGGGGGNHRDSEGEVKL